ncbi:hypothetical protein DID75_00735 [Candidatus Marinamargulisbacteria bacterium SCGC AG-410-N11]|nr:hypothetical protein DID75_00735 [Candidatus Marinamargulisbacteria bacterium SCGC AG-410-N11]
MIKLRLFSFLTYVDLECISAKEAIIQQLKVESLDSIKKYNMFEIQLDVETRKVAEDYLNKIIGSSYYLLNSNKESYYINNIELKHKEYLDNTFFVKVNKLIANDEQKILGNIKNKLHVPIARLNKSIVWELKFKNNDLSKEEITNKIINTTNRNEGLLVNPLFERFSFLESNSIYNAA